MNEDYPVRFSVDYPDRPLNRLTTAFRVFTVIPIAIVMATIGGIASGGGYEGSGNAQTVVIGGTGLLFLPPLLMILFREKYPRWWFDWNLELLRFTNRIGTYVALMNDRYPSTDERQWVELDFPYPDAKRDLNRWLPLVKWFLAIPHYIVLFLLYLATDRRGDLRVVRNPVHRPLPARHLRLRRGSNPLAQPRGRLCLHPHHGPLPAVLDGPAGARAAARPRAPGVGGNPMSTPSRWDAPAGQPREPRESRCRAGGVRRRALRRRRSGHRSPPRLERSALDRGGRAASTRVPALDGPQRGPPCPRRGGGPLRLVRPALRSEAGRTWDGMPAFSPRLSQSRPLGTTSRRPHSQPRSAPQPGAQPPLATSSARRGTGSISANSATTRAGAESRQCQWPASDRC